MAGLAPRARSSARRVLRAVAARTGLLEARRRRRAQAHLDAVAEAVAEEVELTAALGQQVDELEQALVPVLERRLREARAGR